MSQNSIVTTSWWEQYRSAVRTAETHRAEVFVRSLAATPGGHGHRRHVFETLDRAVTIDALDTYDIRIVGDRLCICEDCIDLASRQRPIEKLVRIRQWRERAVEPLGFEEKRVQSSVTGEDYRILVPPELCVAVSVDGDLGGVFPCSIEGEPYGVDDFLATLTTDWTGPRSPSVDI